MATGTGDGQGVGMDRVHEASGSSERLAVHLWRESNI
jgi:hypothetical protein